jgi:hypothetical protein
MSVTFDEALNNYYKLKEKYEEQLINDKASVLSKYKLSWREKRREYKNLVKKCVNCGQSGGTIFTNFLDKQDDTRVLSAVCGHVANPCPLNIKLDLGFFEPITYYIQINEDFVKEMKNKIIEDKNKLLFGYISKEDAIANFDKIKEELNENGQILESHIAEYLEIVDNTQKKEGLKKKLNMSFTYIKEIQEAISNFNSSGNQQFVKDAVDIYIDNLKPILDEIRNLKYSNCSVEYNENDNTYHLMEQKTTIHDLETSLTKPKIISYVIGNINIQPKKTKTKDQETEQKLESEEKTESIIEGSEPEPEKDEYVENQ